MEDKPTNDELHEINQQVALGNLLQATDEPPPEDPDEWKPPATADDSPMNVEGLRRYVAIKKELGELDDRAKLLRQEYNKLEEELLSDFERSGMESTRIDGRTVYLYPELWARANVETGGTEALAAALRQHDLGDFVKPNVSAQTLSAYVREMRKTGTPIPEDLSNHIAVSEKFSLRIRKG